MSVDPSPARPAAPAGDRAANEIRHGARLAAQDPERVWGWDTPAGRLRARRRAALIAAAGGLGPGVRALEIGCGTGLFTAAFAATGADLTAVDISPELVALARRRALPADRVRFRCCRFEEMSGQGDAPFDAVVGSSVLHHLDLDAALRAIHELLAAGGAFAFAEPNMLNPQVFAERHLNPGGRVFPYVSPDETAFVRWRLGSKLAAAGFERVEIVPFDWLHPATPRPLIPAVRAIGRLLEAIPGPRELAGSLLIAGRKPAR